MKHKLRYTKDLPSDFQCYDTSDDEDEEDEEDDDVVQSEHKSHCNLPIYRQNFRQNFRV